MMKAKKNLIVAGVAAVAVVAVGVVAAWLFLMTGFSGDEPTRIYIPDGSSDEDIRSILSSRLGPAGERASFLWSVAGGDPSRAHGSYMVNPGMSPAKIYRMVKNGAQTPVKLTFHNIRTINQLASKVASVIETDSASFMAACDSVLLQKGFTRPGYVAAFLPDTYEFYWTASPEKVVATLSGYRDRFWNDTRRGKAKALGLSPVEVATVASIAEEETNSREERGTVARLYLNRIRKGMMLQADPTVKFAVGDFALRRITGAHLNVNSPYNTYRNIGLPPGPIRIPEAATIDAVLDSKPHNYIYMCAKEDFSGRHNFASDYASHQNNARRYHKALNARNIK